MKEKYAKPSSQYEKFSTADVITTSAGTVNPGDDNDVPWGF